MKQPSLLAIIFVALGAVILFSGQAVRPYAQPRQQRQPTTQPQQQRQTTPAPPKPTTMPPVVAPATEMPSLFWLPEDVDKEFTRMPQGGSRTVTLLGDPKNEGIFVTRTLIPKGTQTIPHFHPDSRTVIVLSGVCYYGRGEEFDEKLTHPLPPGSFFTEPAGVPHFIWAKDGDVVVQTTAIGPSGTQIAPAKKSSVPAR
jgi:quercetin dioxygenase-like cupin family protein